MSASQPPERRPQRGPQRGGPQRGGPQRGGPRGTPGGPGRSWTTTAPSARPRSGDPARRVAFDVLRAVEEQDAYANLVLPRLLRAARLDGRDAAFATELAYGALRGRGTYDAVLAACVDRPLTQLDPPVLDALRLGAHQLLATRVAAHAAVSETVALVRGAIGAGPSGFVNAVLRRVSEHDLPTWLDKVAPPLEGPGADVVAALAVRESHPAWIVRALREALVLAGRPASELPDLLAADNARPLVALAALPGLTEPSELHAAGAEPGRWSPLAAVMPDGDPGDLPAVREARARVQDEGSQLAALALLAAPLAGEDADARWADLCAGPGGKAALLAASAAQRGARLLAVEVAPHRAQLVQQALAAVVSERPGAVEVVTGDGRTVGYDRPGEFDRVLVDAPCTGLGALRRRPEARWRRSPADLTALAPLQRELLSSALDAVRPGGVVAYVTCSPHPAETQAVVDDVVRRHTKDGEPVEVLDAPAVLREVAGVDAGTGSGSLRAQLWPHLHGTDAMSISLLRRPL
ncbi:16S rRNA (cytosine967-C5)-methyltransferase [Quadrisphaera granulorum]|uniref:16S rRNA (Cytosine967-C5)-methyltransferase n=1 Tax=Quadrisphaera granulorum TaxID=317664 RepID=A0A316A0W9_9ACTN|nr:transcription antitermination factor NusB [Quadrisphaera granulorum]PWJ51172.1 16S rRNA (cytosine967-C5)-methyltransferase [Quadrisphaera granulorum]SZE97822.1 16S rRNA (cytosine967-C5)-methyltransferase [Quadrisphaera granulorum]